MRNKVREIPTSNVLLDGALKDIKNELLKLMWVDTVFGRALRLVRYDADGDKTVHPAAYNGKGDYITLEPDDSYGNFIWFDVYDPQRVEQKSNNTFLVTYDLALVCWYDQRKTGFEGFDITTEPVKMELLETLTKTGLFKNVSAKVELGKIYEDPVNVYMSYSMEKIYNRFDYAGTEEQDKAVFMYPYAGIRIDFTLEIKTNICR